MTSWFRHVVLNARHAPWTATELLFVIWRHYYHQVAISLLLVSWAPPSTKLGITAFLLLLSTETRSIVYFLMPDMTSSNLAKWFLRFLVGIQQQIFIACLWCWQEKNNNTSKLIYTMNYLVVRTNHISIEQYWTYEFNRKLCTNGHGIYNPSTCIYVLID